MTDLSNILTWLPLLIGFFFIAVAVVIWPRKPYRAVWHASVLLPVTPGPYRDGRTRGRHGLVKT